MAVYSSDINNDGRIDPLIAYYQNGNYYPVASRDELLFQVNALRKKFINYSSYGNATIHDIIDTTAMDFSKLLVYTSQSSVLDNKGGGFQLKNQTDRAIKECKGNWCFYIQADEAIHEADLDQIRATVEKAQQNPNIDGVLFE